MKVGEYHESGIQDGVEYDYYPACFLVKVLGGEVRKQQSEIQEARLFSLLRMPEPLAFEHSQMVRDYLAIHVTSSEK